MLTKKKTIISIFIVVLISFGIPTLLFNSNQLNYLDVIYCMLLIAVYFKI